MKARKKNTENLFVIGSLILMFFSPLPFASAKSSVKLIEDSQVRQATEFCQNQDQGLSEPFIVDHQKYQIRFPICYGFGENLVVTGSANPAVIDQHLKPLGLYAQRVLMPVGINADGGVKLIQAAIVQVSGIKYSKSTIGGYNEVGIGVLATTKEDEVLPFPVLLEKLSLGRKDGVVRDTGFFIAKLWVDEKKALAAGNQIWRYNKEMSSIVMKNQKAQSPEAHGFSLADSHGEKIFVTTWEQFPTSKTELDALGMNYRFTSYSPVVSIWGEFASQGETMTLPFDSTRDTFELNETSEWGAKLKTWQFMPMTKSVSNEFQAMLFKPFRQK